MTSAINKKHEDRSLTLACDGAAALSPEAEAALGRMKLATMISRAHRANWNAIARGDLDSGQDYQAGADITHNADGVAIQVPE